MGLRFLYNLNKQKCDEDFCKLFSLAVNLQGAIESLEEDLKEMNEQLTDNIDKTGTPALKKS